MKIPDRWLNYTRCGRIKGTRFVAFKVPLNKEFFMNMAPTVRFTPQNLLCQYPKMKLIIDLTFTDKYYNASTEFEQKGIKYIKIRCRGQAIPHEGNFKKFAEEVDRYLEETPEDYLIGIHCTHGVNRTGYMIVRYMIERMGFTPEEALNVFLISRGHGIERTPYIADLLKRKKQKISTKGLYSSSSSSFSDPLFR